MRLGAIAAAAAALLATASAQAPALAQAQAQVQAPASDWRTVAPENLLVIDTSKGRILVELTPVAAPSHAERIRTLADQGFYDGLKFHRVIPDFMAQTGDPQGTGEGGSDLPDLKAEFSFRRGRDAGFTPDDEQNLVQLCERISPIINRSAPEVSFAALDAAKGPEDEGLKQMLSNFGRGDKRDVRQVMKKRVRQRATLPSKSMGPAKTSRLTVASASFVTV